MSVENRSITTPPPSYSELFPEPAVEQPQPKLEEVVVPPSPKKSVKKTKNSLIKHRHARISKKKPKKAKTSRSKSKVQVPSEPKLNLELADPNNFQIQAIPNTSNMYEIKVKEDCWKYFANVNNQYEYILVEDTRYVDNNPSPVFFLINLTSSSSVPYQVLAQCERYAVYRASGTPNELVEAKFAKITKKYKILYDTLNKDKCTPDSQWPKRKEFIQKLHSRMGV